MRRRGMTLVEVLVAMLIFALVAAASALSLRLAVDARAQLSAADDRISELEIARVLIKEDLAQVVARRTRDEFGEPFGPAFLGGDETRLRPPVAGETLLVAFVRGGWSNPEFAAPRSSLQFVEYVVRNGALIRRTRAYLDDARGQPRAERILIDKAANVSIAFLGVSTGAPSDWLVGWPQPGSSSPDAPPRAVRISLTTPRYGALQLDFWIGDVSGASLPPDQVESEGGQTPDPTSEGAAAGPENSSGGETP